MNKKMVVAVLAIVAVAAVLAFGYWKNKQRIAQKSVEEEPCRIFCTTYPIYLFTKEVAEGTGRDVQLLLPPDLGCPHDYALTPGDLMKLDGKHDILVKNGLKLDDVICEAAHRANPDLVILDSSKGIENLLMDEDEVSLDSDGGVEVHHEGEEVCTDPAHHHEVHHAEEGLCEDPSHHHHHDGHVHDYSEGNPHLFGSPFQAVHLVRNIGEQLAEMDPVNAGTYRANAEKYCAELEALCNEFRESAGHWSKRCFAAQHDVFSYLIRDLGLDQSVLVHASAEQTPSAAEIQDIIDAVQARNIPVVFTEPQYPKAIPEMIAREAGIEADVLDPVASGPADADGSYYIETMRKNLETLNRHLK